MKNNKLFNIEEHEVEILHDFEDNNLVSTKNLSAKMEVAKIAADNYVKRDNRVNIRISGADLNIIRRIAIEEGLSYQTLLASVVHKFATGKLGR